MLFSLETGCYNNSFVTLVWPLSFYGRLGQPSQVILRCFLDALGSGLRVSRELCSSGD